MNTLLQVMVDALSSYSGGARTYLRAVLPRLAGTPGVALSVVCRDDQRSAFGLDPWPSNITWVPVPAVVKPLAARLAYSLGVVPVLAAKAGTHVLFCPTDHAPPLAPCATVLMVRNPTPYVRDMATVVAPARRLREAAMRAVTRVSAWQSQATIVVSHAALNATTAVMTLPQQRVHVVHHGRDDRFCPPAPGTVREPGLLLCVSSIYAFKNHGVLLEALHLLKSRHGVAPKVLMAGAAFDAQHMRHLRERTGELGLAAQVEWLGEVPHPQLISLYQRAQLFVMPSRLETFGHPYVEAMATGTASLVADIPCAREMCGSAVEYTPHDRPDLMAAALHQLFTHPDARAKLERAGPVQAAAFSWDRCTRETVAVLQQAAQQKRGAKARPDVAKVEA